MRELLSFPSPGAVASLFALLVSRCQRGRELRDLLGFVFYGVLYGVVVFFVVSLCFLAIFRVWLCASET